MKIAIGGVRGLPARYGGFETSAEETALRIQEIGHDVAVYCRTKEGIGRRSEYCGIKLIYLRVFPSKHLETILHSIAAAFHIALFQRDVDVVHFYNAASIFGGLIVLSLGKPLVITLDGVEWERDKWGTVARAVWRLSTWLAIRLATEVVCDSKVVKALLEKRLEANLKYIPYGAKCVEAASGNNGNFGLERSRYYVFVGRLVPEKAVELLLDAYAELSQSMPLVIIGDNEDDPEYVSGLHRRAKGNVKFLGFRYGAEYEGLLSHARAYLSASKVEGTSPSLLTAMGSRVCCLVRGIPENRETGGDSVLYFDGTIEDLIEKWRLVMDNHDVVAEYGLRGYERVKSTYDWAVVTEQYIAAYHCAIRDAVSK